MTEFEARTYQSNKERSRGDGDTDADGVGSDVGVLDAPVLVVNVGELDRVLETVLDWVEVAVFVFEKPLHIP